MGRTLRRAQLVGGARWIDDQTVQVRLDLSARVVADAVMQLAGAYQRQTGIPPQKIAEATRAWSDRTLTATGLSTGVVSSSAVVVPVRPARTRVAGAEAGSAAESSADGAVGGETASGHDAGVAVDGGVVPPESIEAAKSEAAESLMAALSRAELPGGRSVRELVRLPGVRDALAVHVRARPLRERQRLSDGSVRVVVQLDAARVVEVVRSAAVAANEPWIPTDEATWSAWGRVLAGAVPAEVEGVLPAADFRDLLTRVSVDAPPGWVEQPLEAEGSSGGLATKLLTARQAEVTALRELREALQSLPVGESVSLGQLARRTPLYAGVVDRAMSRARVIRVDYFEDGSATVRVRTDPRLMWQDVLATHAAIRSLAGDDMAGRGR